MTAQDTLPVLDIDAISDTLAADTATYTPIELEAKETALDFWDARPDSEESSSSSQLFMFSSIPWNIPVTQVETLLKVRGFKKDTLDRWMTEAAEDRIICYPVFQRERLSGFQVLYIPGNRSEEGVLKRYREIISILAEKYGNPSKVSVYDMKEYMPDKQFYTYTWTSEKETLTASVNRADRHIDVQYFVEPDSVRIQKDEVEKRLYELF